MGKSVSRCITVTTVIDGENGTNGYNTAVVQLFRRYTPTQEAPTPALPTGTLTYTFSTGKLTGSASYFNGWSQNMPSAASGEKLFVTMATARSQEATDSIAANEWSAPVEYVADGANGEPGISQAPVIIYKRSASQPTDKPADNAKYYFKTVGSGSSKIEAGSLVGTMNGWSTAIPANTNGLPCWTRQATAVAPATADYDEIAASEWSDPATKLVEDGADGTSPYFADIDNEMDSVALDVSGKTTAAYSKTIGVMLWRGSEEMTLTDIVISGTTAAVTATKNVANKTITVSVAAGTSIPLTTELTITPQATGAPNDQSVHFVLNGVKPGANGQHATLYSLIPDADVITKEADGTPTFDILNFTIIKRVGTAETVITSISSFSNEGLKLYYKVGSESEVEVTTSYMSGGYTNVNYHDIEQLYGATDEKIEWILRKASNNQLLDKEGIGSVKDGADGEDSTVPGPAAVMYSISLAGSVLANDPNTGKLIVSIVGRVYKTEGDTTTPYTALTKSNLYLYFEKADGSGSQVPAGDISVSDNQFTTTYQNGANYSNEVFLGVRFNIDNVIKARESIQVVKYGTNGQSITGHTGRFFYYAGDYSGVPGNYAMQETQGPYVKVTNGTAVEFWMLDFKGVEPASFPALATEAPSDQSTQWTKMSSEQQYYIARAFFGPYAHFGSFIINGDWMISQYGTLVDSSGTKTIVNAYNVDTLFNGKVPYAWFDPTDPPANTAPSSGNYKFVPNFAVDGLAGKTYQNDAYIRGEVHATSGEFTGKVTAQSGNIGGFEIGTDRLYNTNWNAGVDISPNDGRNVKIGKNAQGVIGTESAIIRAENTRSGQTYNTSLYLNAQNGEYNYALYGNGNGVLNGLMFGYKVQLHTIPSGNTDAVTYLNIKSGSTIILNGSHSDGHVWIAAPTLSDVRKCLGINTTTTPFAIEFTVVSHANWEYVSIVFRNAITETRYSDYPWLMNTDDEHDGGIRPVDKSIQIAQGDVVKILLLYDNVGTTSNPNYEYRAYDLIRRV